MKEAPSPAIVAWGVDRAGSTLGRDCDLFAFAGCPVRCAGPHFIARWREGAFRLDHASRLSENGGETMKV
jgi:hypothetical protein